MLLSNDFKCNDVDVDHSVFNRNLNNDQITICIHVDDTMITSASLNNVEWTVKLLAEKYGNLIINDKGLIPMWYDDGFYQRKGLCNNNYVELYK